MISCRQSIIRVLFFVCTIASVCDSLVELKGAPAVGCSAVEVVRLSIRDDDMSSFRRPSLPKPVASRPPSPPPVLGPLVDNTSINDGGSLFVIGPTVEAPPTTNRQHSLSEVDPARSSARVDVPAFVEHDNITPDLPYDDSDTINGWLC